MKRGVPLSDRWIEFLNNQPETGMGYVVVSVILNDGRRFDRAVVVDGRITQIYGREDIPFKDENIAELVVTHDKWDFQTGREIGERPHP